MRVGYLECFSGISGDMTLGALVDAGVDQGAIHSALESLGLNFRLTFETVRRCGFRATHAKVEVPHEHVHRHMRHIEEIVERSCLTPRQKELALRVFTKLGEAEAAAHGIELAKIHFHEVGAVDSIVDIVGSAVGLDLLGVDRFEASPIPPGRGSVVAAHGKMPLPAPGTAELLKGVPLAASDVEMELTTPTGAAIVTTVAESFGPLPAMTIRAIGMGAGTRDFPGQANILRLFVGDVSAPAEADRVWVLETNLDDIPGEVLGYATTQLMAAGALDAYLVPIQMKKNRPGVLLAVICAEDKIATMEDLMFRETSTLGIRRYPVSRHKLKRKALEVATRFGPIKGKLGWVEGRTPTFSPEYEDCARLAQAQNVALREVYAAAHDAYRENAPAPPAASPVEAHAHSHEHGHEHGHGHGHSHSH